MAHLEPGELPVELGEDRLAVEVRESALVKEVVHGLALPDEDMLGGEAGAKGAHRLRRVALELRCEIGASSARDRGRW